MWTSFTTFNLNYVRRFGRAMPT